MSGSGLPVGHMPASLRPAPLSLKTFVFYFVLLYHNHLATDIHWRPNTRRRPFVPVRPAPRSFLGLIVPVTPDSTEKNHFEILSPLAGAGFPVHAPSSPSPGPYPRPGRYPLPPAKTPCLDVSPVDVLPNLPCRPITPVLSKRHQEDPSGRGHNGYNGTCRRRCPHPHRRRCRHTRARE